MPLPSYDASVLPDVSALHPELDGGAQLHAAQMLARERALRAIFGPTDPPDAVLSPADPQLNLNWPGGGILCFPPSPARSGWTWVTHGLSQPQPDDEAAPPADTEPTSGLGIEFVLTTPTKAGWAPDLLLNLVRYELFNPNARLIYCGDRVPCGGPIVAGSQSLLQHLLACRSDGYPSELLLPAGGCTLVHLVGATAEEIAHARELGGGTAGSLVLQDVFRRMGVGLVTDPERACLTSRPQFQSVWDASRAELEAAWKQAGG